MVASSPDPWRLRRIRPGSSAEEHAPRKGEVVGSIPTRGSLDPDTLPHLTKAQRALDEHADLLEREPPIAGPDRRARALVVALAVVTFVSYVVWFLALHSFVSAQHEDAGLLLARTCVSERGWSVDTDDCSAIYAVALRRVEVRGGSISSALRALSPTLHGDGTVPRDWLQHLERDGRRPRGWRAASWERHRPLWLQTLDEADALLAGERTHRCVELPTSWGSRTDVRVHLAADPTLRWVDVDCGRTLNRTGRYERRRTSR